MTHVLLPDSACDRCNSVLYTADGLCGECGSARPKTGWGALAAGSDPFLGHEIDEKWFVAQRLSHDRTGFRYRVEGIEVPRTFAFHVTHLEPSADVARRQQMRREASVTRKLQNPHFVACHRFVNLDDEYVGVVMDYIDGRTLQQIVEEDGPLTPPRALDYVAQIAGALRQAHEEHIVHCDLRPANIIIEQRPDGTEFVRITGFGMAAFHGAQLDGGGFSGSPQWASPEQIFGDTVDDRADVYSLGAVLYYLLTGRPPYMADDPRLELPAHLSPYGPPLSDAGTGEFSEALEAFVARLLRRDHRARMSDMLRVLDGVEDLGNLAAQESVDEPMRPEGRDLSEHTQPMIVSSLGADARGFCMQPFPLKLGGPRLASMRGNHVATAVGDGFKLTSLVPRKTYDLEVHLDVTCLAVMNGAVLVGTTHGTVERLAPGTDRARLFRTGGRAITALGTDFLGHFVAAGTSMGDVFVFDVLGASWELKQSGAPVVAMDVGAAGALYAVARDDGTVVVYSAASHAPIVELDLGTVSTLAVCEDRRLLAVSQANEVSVWTLDSARCVHTARRGRGEIADLVFLDEALLAMIAQGESTYLLDLLCRHCETCHPAGLRCGQT